MFRSLLVGFRLTWGNGKGVKEGLAGPPKLVDFSAAFLETNPRARAGKKQTKHGGPRFLPVGFGKGRPRENVDRQGGIQTGGPKCSRQEAIRVQREATHWLKRSFLWVKYVGLGSVMTLGSVLSNVICFYLKRTHWFTVGSRFISSTTLSDSLPT